MRYRDDEIQKLERALSEVYRSQPDRHDVADVTQRVMRDIRQSAGERSRWPSVVDQLVWRTATIAAAVVLAMTILTVGVFQSTAGEKAGLLAEEFDSAPLFVD